jgi:calcineurin-like phosphoesterase family protein
MATYFTADLHFNHEGILKHCPMRQGSNVRQMNEWLIHTWNNTVRRESDIVWILGDFAFPNRKGELNSEEIFWKLRGRKNLIVGNHDEKNKSLSIQLPWDNRVEATRGGYVLPYLTTFRDNGRRAELCHYPLETWKNAHRGALMFHGHSHGNLYNKVAHRFDVGVDVWGRPMDFEELWELSQGQKFRPVDHHAPNIGQKNKEDM